jgi:hypothetical protein
MYDRKKSTMPTANDNSFVSANPRTESTLYCRQKAKNQYDWTRTSKVVPSAKKIVTKVEKIVYSGNSILYEVMILAIARAMTGSINTHRRNFSLEAITPSERV